MSWWWWSRCCGSFAMRGLPPSVFDDPLQRIPAYSRNYPAREIQPQRFRRDKYFISRLSKRKPFSEHNDYVHGKAQSLCRPRRSRHQARPCEVRVRPWLGKDVGGSDDVGGQVSHPTLHDLQWLFRFTNTFSQETEMAVFFHSLKLQTAIGGARGPIAQQPTRHQWNMKQLSQRELNPRLPLGASRRKMPIAGKTNMHSAHAPGQPPRRDIAWGGGVPAHFARLGFVRWWHRAVCIIHVHRLRSAS
jgi:hypothetical protein